MRGDDLGAALFTARLELQPLREDHAPAMFDGLRDPALYRYETETAPASLAALHVRYRELAAGARDPAQVWLNWVGLLRESTAAVGYVQATIDVAQRTATIGYLVFTAQQRQGFGREMVAAACDHLDACGMQRLEAWIDVRNDASIALVEALAFARAGTARSDDVIGGVRGFDHHYIREANANARSVPG